MCNPAILAAAAAAVTAAGQWQSGLYASRMARYQAKVAAAFSVASTVLGGATPR